jgi:hypothetical protein
MIMLRREEEKRRQIDTHGVVWSTTVSKASAGLAYV